jgi:hypothetical protein
VAKSGFLSAVAGVTIRASAASVKNRSARGTFRP